MGRPADSQKLYWQLSQDICHTLPSKRKINTRLVTFLPFFSTFFPFLMFVHWKCPFHGQKTVPHMALHGAQQLSGSFQGPCALFPSGKSFSLCSWWLWGRLTAVPPAMRRWHGGLRAPTALTLSWCSQTGSSSKPLAAFTTVSDRDKSSPCFFSPGKVAETRVTFNNPAWQTDRKVRLKIKNKSTIPSIPKGGGGAA